MSAYGFPDTCRVCGTVFPTVTEWASHSQDECYTALQTAYAAALAERDQARRELAELRERRCETCRFWGPTEDSHSWCHLPHDGHPVARPETWYCAAHERRAEEAKGWTLT